MKSYIAKPQEVERKWYVIDAEGKTLGRLASEAASILRGKKKPIYTPHVDTGDYVIIINAEKVEVTGKKRKEKIYKRHTGYPGGLREITFEKLQAKNPEEIIRHAGNEIHHNIIHILLFIGGIFLIILCILPDIIQMMGIYDAVLVSCAKF